MGTKVRQPNGAPSMIRPTIYQTLKVKLGREPTHAELKADVKRILTEALVESAMKADRVPEHGQGQF